MSEIDRFEQDFGLRGAALRGEMAGIRAALDAGAPVDARNRVGETPLMLAARHGRAEAVRALLEAGADPSAKTYSKGTALMEAACCEMKTALECVEMLLAAGADPDATGGWDGCCALELAIRDGNEAVALRLAPVTDRSAERGGMSMQERWMRAGKEELSAHPALRAVVGWARAEKEKAELSRSSAPKAGASAKSKKRV